MDKNVTKAKPSNRQVSKVKEMFPAGTTPVAERSARQIHMYYLVYREFLSDNGLDDDSNSISVESLVDYVENHIDEEERESLLQSVNQ